MPKGTETDFRNAAVFEDMKSKIDPNYTPVILKEVDNEEYANYFRHVDGDAVYKYDSNNDGHYDTFVCFNGEKMTAFGIKDETDNLGYMFVDYNANTYMYDEIIGVGDTVLDNYFPIYDGEYDSEKFFGDGICYSERSSDEESVIGLLYDHYSVSYNEDGSVKELNIPEDSHYNGI